MEAMKLEIAQLKESLTSLSTAQVDAGTGSSYANRVAAGAARVGSHRLRRGQEGKGRGNVTPSSLEGQKSPKSTRGRPKKRDKLPLPGKRKIWGTMKQCSAGAVHRANSQITSIARDGIEVRRKYKTNNGKTTRWWHVLSGDEETLKTLESEWEGVQQQLDWKIEPCL